MRFVLVTALFALLIVGTSLPAAAAGASDHPARRTLGTGPWCGRMAAPSSSASG